MYRLHALTARKMLRESTIIGIARQYLNLSVRGDYYWLSEVGNKFKRIDFISVAGVRDGFLLELIALERVRPPRSGQLSTDR